MKVPKCKECECLHSYQIGKKTFYDCYHKSNWTTGIRILSKFIKTSPKWCPLRKQECSSCNGCSD
jgi:hypothetical protein